MENFERSSQEGKKIIIETVNGGDRVAAHLFIVPGGFIFADMGWDDSTYAGHPFHYIKCEITKAGYIDTKGRRLDIYVEDKRTPDRGDRDQCFERVRQFYEEFKNDTSIPSYRHLLRIKPETFGARGDTYLWDDIEAYFGNDELPMLWAEFVASIYTAFEELTGKTVFVDKWFHVEKYAHGGMSSGFVEPNYWREGGNGMEFLRGRYEKTLKLEKNC
jgi:hypothetical protein